MIILNWTKLSSFDIKGTILEIIDDSKVGSIPIDFLEIFAKYKPEIEGQKKKSYFDPERKKIIMNILNEIKLEPI